MDEQSSAPIIEDRAVTRTWELDLSRAGRVGSPNKRPTRHRRQQIAHFLGSEGTIERFAIRQTVPYRGYEGEAYPSQAQYRAVVDFYLESCETRFQAHTMLCVRDYAKAVVRPAGFTAPRREFIWLCTAAFLLADKDLRARIRSWSARAYTSIEVGIANHAPYKRATKFVEKLIADMQAQGSQIFGWPFRRAAMTIKRLPGDEAALLGAVLDRLDGMLRPYGLAAEYSIDVQDNSYTASVHAIGLAFDETWLRLQHYDELRAILEEVVFAPDERARTLAVQRAGCMLDSRLPRAVK